MGFINQQTSLGAHKSWRFQGSTQIFMGQGDSRSFGWLGATGIGGSTSGATERRGSSSHVTKISDPPMTTKKPQKPMTDPKVLGDFELI